MALILNPIMEDGIIINDASVAYALGVNYTLKNVMRMITGKFQIPVCVSIFSVKVSNQLSINKLELNIQKLGKTCNFKFLMSEVQYIEGLRKRSNTLKPT